MKEQVLNKKKAIVQEIKDKIESSDSVVLMEYSGITVEEVTDLRSKFRESDVDYKVYKNTMMKFAFEDAGYDEFLEFLQGPNAVAFSKEGDPVSAAKVSCEFAKDNDSIKIKAGIVDGKIIDLEEIQRLAKLPSKEVLVAQVLGGLQGPIRGLATVLNGNISGLARVLNQIKDQKEEASA